MNNSTTRVWKHSPLNAPAKALIFALLTIFCCTQNIQAQSPCTGAPQITANFVGGNAGTSITTDAITRDGLCCPATPVEDEECVDIKVMLDALTAQVNLVALGAPANGSLFYSVDCGPKYGIGTPICITNTTGGVEEHHISFCKPGGNDYAFTITSIAFPTWEDITLKKGCDGHLVSKGILPAGSSWHSTYPGTPGQYDYLLSCTDCPAPIFQGGEDLPSVIKFEACGYATASVCENVGNQLFCDEVVVTILDTRWYEVDDQTICEPATTASLGTAPDGGSWSAAPGNPANASINASTGAITGMTANGDYQFLLTSDDELCTAVVTVTRAAKPNAGDDQIVCLPTTTASLGAAPQGQSWSANGGNPAAASVDASTGAVSGLTVAGDYFFTLGSGSCSDEVKITVGALVNVSIDDEDLVINCYTGSSIVLDGSSTTPNAQYAWSGAGIVGTTSDDDVTVSAAGTFTLKVTDPATGCTASDFVNVSKNTTAPADVDAGDPKTLTCSIHKVTLNGSSSTEGVDYEWSGPGIDGPNDGENVDVTATGTYTLKVTNPVNGCTASDNVEVGRDEARPDVDAGDNATLTCVVGEVSLHGSSETDGAQYEWSGPGISSNAFAADIDVTASGTYTLKVTDPSNGCTASDNASVNEDKQAPNINAGGNRTISCNDIEITLVGSSSTQGAQFLWSTNNGNIVSQADGDAIVDEAGTYTLKVTNPSNGCTVSSTVTVSDAGDQPVCDLDLPLYLPLDSTDGNKLHSGSSNYAVITWKLTSSDPDWVITSGQGTPDIEYSTGAPGTYGIFKVIVSSASGECKDSCQIQLFAASGEGFCSMSQGFYGNAGGKVCDGGTTTQVLTDLLQTPLTVGVNGVRSLTFSSSDVSCVLARMPGGGPAAVLPPTNANQLPADMTFTANCSTTPFTVPTKNGRFRNILLAQTITTGLNMRLSPGLASFRLEGPYLITAAQDGGGCIDESKGITPGTETYHSISQAVLNYLGPNNTVLDVWNLANQVLAGNGPQGFTPSDMVGAVSVFTDAFHGCRRFVGFSNEQPQVFKSGDEQLNDDMDEIYDENLNLNAAVSVYPNPFGNSTNIEYMMTKNAPLKVDVLDATGRVVSVIFNGNAEENMLYSTQFNSSSLSNGMYIVRFVSDNLSIQKRIILQR